MSQSHLPVFLAVGTASFVLVGIVREMAVHRGVIDHPTDRGSHAVPTPRGGGLGAIIAVLGVGLWLAGSSGDLQLVACLLAAAAVAAIGWFDDSRGLGIRIRLAVHIVAALTVGVLSLRGADSLALAVGIFAWWTFWTVSSINLVNFMDGINGFVALQVAVFAGSLVFFGTPGLVATSIAAAVAAACLGFLPWNFPRARIFLGDVGSGSLGFLVPCVALLAMQETGIDLVRAHLPLLPLFGDATVTIWRRWHAGEVLTQPHRSHLYQRLANGGLGHTWVTLIYAGAAVAGAIVAHLPAGPALLNGVIFYVASVVLIGLVLHRRLVAAPLR